MAAKNEPGDSAASSTLVRARSAADRSAWGIAFAEFAAADREGPLDARDLERFAEVAHMLGRNTEVEALGLRAHQAFVSAGNPEGAARCAFWLGLGLVLSGESARGGGWLARAQRLLDDARIDSALRGYLLVPQGIRLSNAGAYDDAYATFAQALEIAKRFGDRNLIAVARNAMGRALTNLGRIAEGTTLIDEAMAAVSAGEVEQAWIGSVYCSVIETCHSIFDLRRAQEWTDSLSRWCESQPEMVPFRGQCLVHRAEMMQLHGDWSHATDEARRACEWLADPPGNPAAGSAYYRAGELHRVRGAFAEAEAAYRAASERGRQPHPGLALLWLAQRRPDAAVTAIRGLLSEHQPVRKRIQVLEAGIEIALAANDVALARTAAMELAEFAERAGAPYLAAAAAHGMGWTLLTEGEPAAALDRLREAEAGWRALRAPFEGARTQVLLGLAHRALGDEGTAALELDDARRTFEAIGALPALARLDAVAKPTSRPKPVPLTTREVDVLANVARGKTNRAIAKTLGISEKTVARHVSNIFTKLNLPNRAAATAYAYEHHLLDQAPT